jgi:hypothetical protein
MATDDGTPIIQLLGSFDGQATSTSYNGTPTASRATIIALWPNTVGPGLVAITSALAKKPARACARIPFLLFESMAGVLADTPDVTTGGDDRSHAAGSLKYFQIHRTRIERTDAEAD